MTRQAMMAVACAAGFAGGLGACAERRPVERATVEPAPVHADFKARLRQIGREYRNWARVSDLAQWAPALCRTPQTTPGIRMSQSIDFETHGRKLYYVFAQNAGAYRPLAWQTAGQGVVTSPVGQALVKESWFAEPLHGATTPFAGYGVERTNAHTARGADGREYRAGAKGDLFVMFKMDPLTGGTDDGWVYGTLTPDGTTVTSIGRVQSCMNCHQQAPHDRLFGPK